MMPLELDLVDLLLDREDLGPDGLSLAADLLREAPAPAGPLDARGANEALADLVDVFALHAAGRHLATARHVLPVALSAWLSALAPGLIVSDARGGACLARNRRRIVVLFGREVGEAFLAWIHGERLTLERTV